jgi:MFS family permease
MSGEGRTRLRNLTILAGSTLTVMAGATITPALPAMEAAFAAVPRADLLVKLALSLPALFIALGGSAAGWLLDRWGRRPVLLVAVLLYTAAGSAGYWLDSLGLILVSRACLGIAVAGTMTGCTTLIGDHFDGLGLDRFLGLQGAATAVGGVLFLLAGGVLADISWRHPFLVYLFALVVLPGILLTVRDAPPGARQTTIGEPPTALRWKPLLPYYALALGGMLAFYLVPTQIAFYLRELGVETNAPVGIAVALMTVFSAVGSLLYRRLKDRTSTRGVFRLNFALMGGGYILLGLAGGYVVAVVALVIAGLGMGLFLPNLNAALLARAPRDHRGRILGGSTTALYLGQFVAPLVAAPVVVWLGYAGLYLTAGGAMLAAVALSFRLPRDTGA